MELVGAGSARERRRDLTERLAGAEVGRGGQPTLTCCGLVRGAALVGGVAVTATSST